MAVRTRIQGVGDSLHFVTTTVTNWIPIFNSRQCAIDTLQQFRETSQFFAVSVIGYVLMPSHLHALIGLPASVGISRYMQSFKSLSSRRLKARALEAYGDRFVRKDQFTFWKRRFDDFQVWTVRQFRINLEYIHNNPVRAGIVDDALKYECSSARDWSSEESGWVAVDKDWSWINSEIS